jgi:8-oxo-dGTP diphosphatase
MSPQELLDCIGAEDAGVLGGRRQSAHRLVDDRGTEGSDLIAAFPGHPLGERGAGGDRGGAAANFVSHFHRDSAFETGGEAQDVAAGRIGNFDGHGRGRELSHVARILKVIDQTFGIHARVCSNIGMVQVVAGILERDGRILICRRTPAQQHPLKWEFPGGKVEAGESPTAALARELEEELGIRAAASEEIARYEYEYPGKKPILLMFLRVTDFTGEPRNRIFHEMRWEPVECLGSFDFVEGDRRFLRILGSMATAIKMVEPAENEFLASLEAKSKKPSPFFRGMAHRPEVLKNFVPLYGAVMGPGTVERRVKELVYLTCSYANECAFCTWSHVAGGKKAGISDDEMRALQTEQDHGFSEPERAAIRYARELTRNAVADEERSALFDHFNDEQVVELTLVASMANFTNRFNNGLGIQPEE